jgi:hypothetical protein
MYKPMKPSSCPYIWGGIRPATRLRWILPLCGTLLLAPMGFGQDLIPLKQGNYWNLRSEYSTAPMSLTITDVYPLGPLTEFHVDFNNPWIRHKLLLSQDASGVKAEGYSVNGVTYRFSEATLYFAKNVAPGSSWQTPFGVMSLEQSNLEINGRSNCSRYRLRNPDGTSTVWVLQPGFGFVQFGEGPAAFQVSTYLSDSPSPTFPVAKPIGPCPPVGLASMPAIIATTTAMREASFAEANAGGSKWVNVNATWQELEPFNNVFALTRITDELRLARESGQRAVLTLKLPNTTVSGLPSDLASRSLSDSTVRSRLERLLDRMAPLIRDTNVGWINLGYEVDTFLFLNPSQQSGFFSLYDAGKTRIRSLRSNVPVGMVFSFDTTRMSDQVFNQLKSRADHISFNYYGLGPNFTHRATSAPLSDIPLMLHLGQGKQVLLTELGYSTAGANGSSTRQQEFLSNAFTALRSTSGRVAGISVWAMRDLPANIVATVGNTLGLAHDTNFNNMLKSSGLKTEDGSEKIAWSTFRTSAQQFPVLGTCTVP